MPQNVFVGPAAEFYDATSQDMSDPNVIAPTVEFLAGLAADGTALEFAIGTGRVALPLRERGVDVRGIEISLDMIAQLRSKPGGVDVPIVVGDMATTIVPGEFSLVYLVYNTISNLLTQEEQVQCFGNAAAHLRPGGYFVIELNVPKLRSMPLGEDVYPFDVTPEHLGFERYDFMNQRSVSHHYWFNGNQNSRFDSHHRYVWPSELDLMAMLAGMTLQQRWQDWDRTPFTGESQKHVSVWQLPA